MMMNNISTNCREIEKFPREICFPEESPEIKPHSEGHSQCSRRPSVPTALSQKLGHWSFPPHSVVLAFQAFECKETNFGHILWKSWTHFLEIFIDIESRDKSTQNHVLDCALLLNSIGQLVAYTGGEITDAREDWFHLLRDAITICESQF